MRKLNLFIVGLVVIVFCFGLTANSLALCYTQQGTVSTPSQYVKDIDVVGSYAYAAIFNTGSGGALKIINVSDPDNPAAVTGGEISVANAQAVHVANGYAYVLSHYNGNLYVVDISDPGDMEIVDSMQIGTSYSDYGKDVFVLGSYAYVVTYLSGLHIVDISNPQDISEAENYFSIYHGWSVSVHGNYAYVGGSGIRIVDISDPDDPTDAGSIGNIGIVYKTELRWPYLYAACGDFRIFDISDPEDLDEIGYYDTGYASTLDLSISENGLFAFLANSRNTYGSIEAVNINSLENPTSVCQYPAAYENHIGSLGNNVFVGKSDFKSVEFDLPLALAVSLDHGQGRIEGKIVSTQETIINCGDGHYDCGEVFASSTAVQLTAYPKAGYAFDHWQHDEGQSTNNPVTILVQGTTTWTGMFEEFNLTFPVDGYSHTTVPISAVMDHSLLNGYYTVDGRNSQVKAYNGLVANGAEHAYSGSVYCYDVQGTNPFPGLNYIYIDEDEEISEICYDEHPGFDFAVASGTNILAPADGKLYWATSDLVNGIDDYNTFYIDHENGYTTWFLHCSGLTSSVLTEIQQNGYAEVEAEDHVAESGSAGSGSPHLHFEVRLNGIDDQHVIDPYGEDLWE